MDFSKPKRDRILKKITFGGKLNKKSHKNSAKHNHKKRDLESHQNHAAENKHYKGEMPMKHEEWMNDWRYWVNKIALCLYLTRQKFIFAIL